MTTHHIRLNQIGAGIYACTGAVQITRTTTPIIDAALALKAAGAPDSDTISAMCGDASILPATIGSILNFRHTARRQELFERTGRRESDQMNPFRGNRR
jgi:hypothetical protein